MPDHAIDKRLALALLGALLTVVLLSSRESTEHAEAARSGELDAQEPASAAAA